MKKNWPVKLGNKIKEIREMRGLSQALLAGKMGKTVGTISNIERGITTPSLLTLNELADVLDVEIQDFFSYESGIKSDDSFSQVQKRMQLMSAEDRALLAVVAEGMCRYRKKGSG